MDCLSPLVGVAEIVCRTSFALFRLGDRWRDHSRDSHHPEQQRPVLGANSKFCFADPDDLPEPAGLGQ